MTWGHLMASSCQVTTSSSYLSLCFISSCKFYYRGTPGISQACHCVSLYYKEMKFQPARKNKAMTVLSLYNKSMAVQLAPGNVDSSTKLVLQINGNPATQKRSFKY